MSTPLVRAPLRRALLSKDTPTGSRMFHENCPQPVSGVPCSCDVSPHLRLCAGLPLAFRAPDCLPAEFVHDARRNGMLQENGGELRHGRGQSQMLRQHGQSIRSRRRSSPQSNARPASIVRNGAVCAARRRLPAIHPENSLAVCFCLTAPVVAFLRSKNLIASGRPR